MGIQFRTEVKVARSTNTISYQDKILCMGSCFADEIGKHLSDLCFTVQANPLGIVYNPIALTRIVSRIIDGRFFGIKDFHFRDGKWVNFELHGDFSAPNAENAVEYANTQLRHTRDFLTDGKWVILTLGTAWVYKLLPNELIVANCHKWPSSHFLRQRLSVDEIIKVLQEAIVKIKKINPDANILMTVSPIRHLADGAVQNNLSKATLLLAVHEVCNQDAHCLYFPSFELLMDDLRDYRFYKEDLVHPSKTALDYIWSKFAMTFLSPETSDITREVAAVRKRLDHRPFNAQSPEYIRFREQTDKKIKHLQDKYGLTLKP